MYVTCQTCNKETYSSNLSDENKTFTAQKVGFLRREVTFSHTHQGFRKIAFYKGYKPT